MNNKIKVVSARTRYSRPDLPPQNLPEQRIEWGRLDKQHVQIFISEVAYKKAVKHARSDLNREVGGLLVGKLFQDNQYFYVHIEDAVPDNHGKGTSATYAFTYD